MGLFGLLAAIFAFYGMGAANKGVLGGVWTVVGDMTTLATNVTTQVDNLLGSISNISTAVGDFQGVVRNDLDVPGFRTNLAVSGWMKGWCELEVLGGYLGVSRAKNTACVPLVQKVVWREGLGCAGGKD
jgi:hypothetical protein